MRTDATSHMVERQHRMGFAAAEIGLQLDHWITACSGQAFCSPRQQSAETVGEVGPAEELFRVGVLRRRTAIVDLA
ncbi:hypothetical protein D3C80_195390 [compost metagenome]